MLNFFSFKIVFLALIPFAHEFLDEEFNQTFANPFRCVDYQAIKCPNKTSAKAAPTTGSGKTTNDTLQSSAPEAVPVLSQVNGPMSGMRRSMANSIDQLLSEINEISGDLIEKIEGKTNSSEEKVTSESNVTRREGPNAPVEGRAIHLPPLTVTSLNAIDRVNGSIEVKGNVHQPTLQVESTNFSKICDPNPCLYGGRCQMVAGNDYECKGCLSLTTGKNCQKVNCGPWICLGWKGTLYVVLEAACGWEEANWKCASEGMTLAMPKRKETNEWLVGQLSSVYGVIEQLGLWLGLRREGRGWRWIDGRPLGPYTGGNPQFQSNANEFYGILYLRSGTWLPVHINFQSFPLCEKRYYNPSAKFRLF